MINYYVICYLIYLGIDVFKYVIAPNYFLIDGIRNDYFKYSMYITNLHISLKIITIIIVTILFNKNRKYNRILQNNSNINERNLKFISKFFIIIFILLFIVMSNEFGFINWIINPRRGYQFYRIGKGSIFAMMVSTLAVAISTRFIVITNKKEYFFYFIFFLFGVYLLGSKGRMIQYFIFVSWIGYEKKIINFNKIFILGTLVVILLFYNLYSSYGYLNIKKMIGYFDYMRNASNYYAAYFNKGIPLFCGKIFITGFWKYIPRGLYPNKPFVYGSLLINEYFFPGAAAKTHTPSFGGEEIAYFADFGVVGVIIFTIFNFKYYFEIIGLNLIIKNKKIVINTIFKLVIFIAIFAPNYGDYFSTGLQIILFIFIYFLIKIIIRMKKR